MNIWSEKLIESSLVFNNVIKDQQFLTLCKKWSDQMIETAKAGNNFFVCGNGGSRCDAMHFAEELTGRYKKNRPPIGALALGDAAHMSCVANDYGYDNVFSRQLEGLGRSGDMLIAISTSGNSKNVIKAVEVAQQKKIFIVGLLGKDGGQIKNMCHLPLVAPSDMTERIQEIHIKLIHTAIESMERVLFPENYLP